MDYSKCNLTDYGELFCFEYGSFYSYCTNDPMDAVAHFLYRKQRGESVKWRVYPGKFTSADFYTISLDNCEFVTDEQKKTVLMFDTEQDAIKKARQLRLEKCYICRGGVNSDGLIAGPEKQYCDDIEKNTITPQRKNITSLTKTRRNKNG